MIPSFPKIFTFGDKYISNILEDIVEISEKIDGSFFAFGKVDGVLCARSRGQQIVIEAPPDMFKKAVDYIQIIEDKLVEGEVYYCEYLEKPHHNVLTYNRVPKNNLILFNIKYSDGIYWKSYHRMVNKAEELGIEVIPLLMYRENPSKEDITQLLETESILGGVKIEGVVIKNYLKDIIVGGQVFPMICGKYVSTKFKEKHNKNWKRDNTSKGKWVDYMESFNTEARWQKAIQHLKEADELEHSPKDIGKLILEIKRDIEEEEKENIKEFLWNYFGKDLLRASTKCLPEWYKDYLSEPAVSFGKGTLTVGDITLPVTDLEIIT